MFIILRTLTTAGVIAFGIVSLAGYSHPANVAPARIKVAVPESQTPTRRADRLPLFEQQWDATRDMPPSATRVRLIQLAKAAPPVAEQPVRIELKEPEPEPRHHKAERERPRDVCERHGLHKVTIRGGRSWRCRR